MPALVFKVITGLCAAFLGITFFQSAYDKIRNYSASKAYFSEQFAKSPLKNSVNLLLPAVTVLELLSALCCFGGIILRILHINRTLIGHGLLLSSITLLCLLFGQRVAKDYAGAASITGYFLIAILGLMMFGLSI